MRRRLLAGFLAFAVVCIVLLVVPLGVSLTNNATSTAISEIEHDSSTLALLVSDSLQRGDVREATALLDRFTRAEHAIVAVVAGPRVRLSSGAGVSEELADPTTKAILASANAGRVQGEEGSKDPDDDLLYVAIPLGLDVRGGPAGTTATTSATVGAVLLVAEPASSLHAKITSIRVELALFGAAMLAIAAAIGALLAVSLTRPLAGIEATVARFGAGQFSTRVAPTRAPPELRALRTTINTMADRIEELLRTQRAFVADASHQLRAPMTALRLRLENLEGAIEPAHEAELGPVIAEVDRLSRVVDGLLALARTDGTRPEREQVDVVAVLEERAAAWEALADEHQLALVDATAPDRGAIGDLTALACAGHLEQVVDNLLANAIDATPAGGHVTLSAARTGKHVEIHVVDTGPGLSDADRLRAFDRFWRPDGASGEGTGLGLAIVAQLVRVSGGSTRLDAAPGGGVDAVVLLDAS